MDSAAMVCISVAVCNNTYLILQDNLQDCQSKGQEEGQPLEPQEDPSPETIGPGLEESKQPPMTSTGKKDDNLDEDEITELLSEGNSLQDVDHEEMDEVGVAGDEELYIDDEDEGGLLGDEEDEGGIEDLHICIHALDVESIAVRVDQQPETRCRKCPGKILPLTG